MEPAKLLSARLSGAKSLIQSYGVDPIAIARSTRLPPEALEHDNIVIEALTFYHFVMAAAEKCKDRYWAIRLAESQEWRLIDGAWDDRVEGHSVGDIMYATVRELEQRKGGPTAYTSEFDCGTLFCLELRWMIPDKEILNLDESLIVEYALANVCLGLREILGSNWSPEYVQFRHSAPQSVRPLQRCFGEKVNFNQDCNAIFLTHKELASPIPQCRNQILRQRAIPVWYATEETSAWRLKVDSEIRKSFLSRECAIGVIATQLGISVRGLQRHLKKEGVSYQEILDKVRMECALHYLKSSRLGVSDVAERLHFSETAVFSRFFKNRLGISPSVLLQQRNQRDTDVFASGDIQASSG